MPSQKSHHPGRLCLLGDSDRVAPALCCQHVANVIKMSTVISLGPNLRGFGEEHSVGERHDHLASRPRDAKQLGGHCLRVLQVLPSRHDQAGVDEVVRKWQGLFEVEVLHPVTVKSRIGSQLLSVEAVANDPLITDVVGEVGDP